LKAKDRLHGDLKRTYIRLAKNLIYSGIEGGNRCYIARNPNRNVAVMLPKNLDEAK